MQPMLDRTSQSYIDNDLCRNATHRAQRARSIWTSAQRARRAPPEGEQPVRAAGKVCGTPCGAHHNAPVLTKHRC